MIAKSQQNRIELVTRPVLNSSSKDAASKVTEEEIISYVNARVNADFKKIRGKVLFRSDLPRNTVGKLLRRDMREWAEKEATKLY